LSVVLFALNGEPSQAHVAAWLAFVEASAGGSQLLVIDDGSPQHLSPHAKLRVIHHTEPMGLGASLQTSLWSLTTPLVLFVAPQSHFTPEHAGPFLEHIDNADLVVGCRRAGTTPALVFTWDLFRSVLARVFLGNPAQPRLAWPGWRGWRRRWAARRLFGVPLTDPESGVLMARRDAITHIPIQSIGPFCWIELIAKANHLGCLLDEMAIEGQSRPSVCWLRDAWRVFRRPEFFPAR
jgi:hypothetical protein